MSSGSGSGSPITTGSTAKATTTVKTATTVKTTATTASSATSSTVTAKAGKPVFFHYLIGTITDAHCQQDIQDAMALGADAFALNINTDTASWATTTVDSLFKWANVYGFKLFFSFDMTGFSNLNQSTNYLLSWVANPAHYIYNSLPFVSTFNGGASDFTFGQDSVNDGWKVELEQVMAHDGYPIYFVPAFQDVTVTSSFFQTFPSLNG
jgi:glucan endo-1,3-alpha-glucosidase